MRVGWIGLGSIGRPMALSALGGGHALAGYARRPHEHDAISAAGGCVTDNVADAVATAELVCVNLFSEAQIREVMIADGGLAALAAGAILAVHSTVSPAFVRELAGLRDDIHLLDAGFSGSAEDAAAGRLTLMVGGEAAVLARARPVLATYAGHIAHLGPLGSGMALKVINNLTFAAQVAIAADALRLVAESGLASDVAVDTLMRGSARSYALDLLGRSGRPQAVVAALKPFLDKDVPIARAGADTLDLGTLDGATRCFAA